MSLSARAIALQGIWFGALLVAVQGFSPLSDIPVIPPIPPPIDLSGFPTGASVPGTQRRGNGVRLLQHGGRTSLEKVWALKARQEEEELVLIMRILIDQGFL